MAKEVTKEAIEKKRAEVVANLASARGVEVAELKDKYIGNNGFAAGQEVEFTGVVDIIKSEGITPYYGAFLTNGSNVSVQSLMGISSLKGYKTEGEHENTIKASNRENNRPAVTEKVTAYVCDDFAFSEVTQPHTRELYEFVAWLQETEYLKGRKGRFLGQVVRPFPAKKAGKMGDQSWNKDDQRCQVAKLWNY